MRKIDLEAHFLAQSVLETGGGTQNVMRNNRIAGPLLDLGEGRLKAMDDNGIDMQVLSVSAPRVQQIEPDEGTAWSKKINDELSQAVKAHPDRFIGLAAIAPQSPTDAADELERAVSELGLKGVCILSHTRNEYLDDPKYWVIFERAEKLDAPIYIHPATPSTAMLKAYEGYDNTLSGAALGFAAEVSLHAMRLIVSGLFDKYPKLKIILGHMGEGLPYWLPRLDIHWRRPLLRERIKDTKIEKFPSEYIKTNFTMTTSGMYYQPALICAYLALSAENIVFAADYPYEDLSEAVQFIEAAPICDVDKEKICYSNAARLFKL